MIGPILDLAVTGYTERGSRLVVIDRRETAGGAPYLDVCDVAYEQRPTDRRSITKLTVADGVARLVPTASADGVRWADAAHLVIAGGLLSLRMRPGASLRWHHPPSPAGEVLSWAVNGKGVDVRQEAGCVQICSTTNDLTVRWCRPGLDRDLQSVDHDVLACAAADSWRAWMAKAPRVAERWQDVVDRSWWQLAANIVRLDRAPEQELVVPSKLGYVGAWQWDSYFIAVGLRHGDPELAAEQIRFFLDHQQPSGFIPDVVHDSGQISSVADLPESERDFSARVLRRAVTSPELRAIPVTKPPLASWAADLVREAGGPDLIAERGEQLDRLREWWLARPSPDGLPGFEHPYSSGFDDSPLFDDGAPVYAPDLPAYLVVEADVLAAAARRAGDEASAVDHVRRAEQLTASLIESRWDAERRLFRVLTPMGASAPRTPIDLLPLLTGRLPEEIAAALVADLADPDLFATPWPVPTVACGETPFDADRMWRGPVWVNINWLLVQGLRRSGRAGQARVLAERTLELAARTPGCFEYYRSDTGAAASGAVAGFGWTAALLVDLAVWLTSERGGLP